jgi:CheY-like chemotaxis protein
VEEAMVGGTSVPERVKMPRKWMVAMASTETGNHMAFTSANCTVMCRSSTQIEGFLSGTPTNGQQALEKVKKLKPDLVLLDISMPVMNGLRAAYEIRRLAPSTKIIFFTVDGSGDARMAAHALGVTAFVTKSEGPELIQTVKRLLA